MSSSEIRTFIASFPKEEMRDCDWRSTELEGNNDTIFEPFEVAKAYLGTELMRLTSR